MTDLIVLLKQFLRFVRVLVCGIGADASLSIRSTRLSQRSSECGWRVYQDSSPTLSLALEDSHVSQETTEVLPEVGRLR